MANTIKKNQTKNKLVIAISSRALFNLDESHKIFKEQGGVEAYAKHQEQNEAVILQHYHAAIM